MLKIFLYKEIGEEILLAVHDYCNFNFSICGDVFDNKIIRDIKEVTNKARRSLLM